MEIPTAAIHRLQSFIREAGSAPSPSPAAAPAPPFPSVADAVAAFDSDASPELRCGRCGTAGGLLCGAQSAVCVYCGCPRLEEGGGVAFRDSAAYLWLLGSLGLDGSEPVEGFPGGGRAECSGQREVAPKMEDKPTVRKKPVPSDSPRVKAESGTCNVCCAPCSSCLHRNLVLADSNMYCGSSQTCCTRSETKNSSFVHSEKGLHTKGGENDDEFSATSSHASYSENGGNKAMARSYIGADSEVDMPAKGRKLLNHDARSLRVECQDDSNSCVTGVSAAGKLLLDKKKDKLSTSASNRDLTVKGYKDNNVASHNRLKNYCVEDSTEKKRSDVHVMHPSSSDRSVPADSLSVTKKLLRTQSSVSASQGLSHKRPTHGFGNSGDNLAHQFYEKASLSNNNIQHSPGGKLYPAVIGGDKHGCWGLRSRCWGRELNQMDLLFCIPVRIYNIYNIYI